MSNDLKFNEEKKSNYEQINILNFIKANDNFKSTENNDKENENTNYKEVKNEIVKDDNVIVNQKNTSKEILTYEEFKKLFERQIKGEELTEEELIQLKNAAPIYFEELQKEETNKFENIEEKESVLTPYKNNNSYYGFANKNFILYVFIIAVFIALMLSVIFQSVN